MLSFDAPPGVTAESFAAACREQLGETDAAAAEALLRRQPMQHPFVEAWEDKEAILRNAVARQRARAKSADPTRWMRPTRGCDKAIETGVEDAFQETDPLKREKALDKVRWTLAEDWAGPDPLSIRAVFAYAVKLAVLWRWRSLDAARGAQVFDELTSPLSPNPEP